MTYIVLFIFRTENEAGLGSQDQEGREGEVRRGAMGEV